MHDHAGRVQNPPQPEAPRAAQFGPDPLVEVARLDSGADLRPCLLEHAPCDVDRERVVDAAGELVNGREVAQLHVP